jgi:hypothetical protein
MPSLSVFVTLSCEWCVVSWGDSATLKIGWYLKGFETVAFWMLLSVLDASQRDLVVSTSVFITVGVCFAVRKVATAWGVVSRGLL